MAPESIRIVSVVVVLGTRPEIVKMALVIMELARREADFFILHTGQHYSYNLDRAFFEQLRLPGARFNLEVGSDSHAGQTAKIMAGVERVLAETKASCVLAEGDTNSVLGACLAAAKLPAMAGHVEAGLRSYDRRMPEEINRILADHCSDHLFAPTPQSRRTLLQEGIPDERIHMTGNTIVDAVQENLESADRGPGAPARIGLRPGEYFLVTLHRQENVDDAARLSAILAGLNAVDREFGLPVLWPIHPRSRARLREFGIEPGRVMLEKPMDYLAFLGMEQHARLILTDSGGVQEEACVLGVPCVTLRDNTERPETLEIGCNVLAGADGGRIMRAVRTMLCRERRWPNPFGDGRAAGRIVDVCLGGTNGQDTCHRGPGFHRLQSRARAGAQAPRGLGL